MPEHHGFQPRQVDGRAIVHLRVRPDEAEIASEALHLPSVLRWQGEDPVACWLGPDQWLMVSDTQSAKDLAGQIQHAIPGQLHAVTDMSSGYVCLELKGPTARMVLAMGCGIDLHPQSFKKGQCVRTLFAGVSLIIIAAGENHFELYLDRSLAGYVQKWLVMAGEDPFTRG